MTNRVPVFKTQTQLDITSTFTEVQLVAFVLRTCKARTCKCLLSRPTERRVQRDRAVGEGVDFWRVIR